MTSPIATDEQIFETIRRIVDESPLAPLLRGIEVGQPDGNEDDTVVRLRIRLAHHERVDHAAAIRVIRDIGDRLREIDSRFPSVYFAEAA